MSSTTMPISHETNQATNMHVPSSSALLAAIFEALRQTGYGQLRHLELQCDGDSITIAGRVPSYFLKQFAQAAILRVSGVGGVKNEIQVASQ
jgi:hypothetical protein